MSSRKIPGRKKTVVKLILCQNEAMQTLIMPNISHSVMDLIPNSSMILYFAGLIDCFWFFKFICAFLLLQLFLGDFFFLIIFILFYFFLWNYGAVPFLFILCCFSLWCVTAPCCFCLVTFSASYDHLIPKLQMCYSKIYFHILKD